MESQWSLWVDEVVDSYVGDLSSVSEGSIEEQKTDLRGFLRLFGWRVDLEKLEQKLPVNCESLIEDMKGIQIVEKDESIKNASPVRSDILKHYETRQVQVEKPKYPATCVKCGETTYSVTMVRANLMEAMPRAAICESCEGLMAINGSFEEENKK